MGGASTGNEKYGNMDAEKLRKSGMKNGHKHLNIESCVPTAVAEVPKQIKESANYNNIELSSRASGKREHDTIDKNIRQKNHCVCIRKLYHS